MGEIMLGIEILNESIYRSFFYFKGVMQVRALLRWSSYCGHKQ